MNTEREAGHIGQLISLGGVVGRSGTGRRLEGQDITCASAANVLLLSPNSLRLWALITNPVVNTANFYVAIGGTQHILVPGGHILINEHMPWTGSIRAQQIDVASAVLTVSEASLDIER